MRNSSHTSARSASCLPEVSTDPDPSGVRLTGPDEDDPDCDDDEAPEGSFFGASDEAATNRVWGMFSRKQVKDGHGADLKAAHDKRFPVQPQSAKFIFGRDRNRPRSAK